LQEIIMTKTIIVKVGSHYVTSDGSLSPSQSDALRIGVPFSADPNVNNATARIVTLRTKNVGVADLD
jgi:hypothetical protein